MTQEFVLICFPSAIVSFFHFFLTVSYFLGRGWGEVTLSFVVLAVHLSNWKFKRAPEKLELLSVMSQAALMLL